MAIDTASTSVFDADLPTLTYDVTETPFEVYGRLREAQQQSPVVMGPVGPEVLSYEFARALLRDNRFVIPPGIHLTAQGVTSGPLWDKVVSSIMCKEGTEHHRLRSLVSRAFTPRATSRLRDTIDDVINKLFDRVDDAGRCDVVADISRSYPIPIICALLGAPPEDWANFRRVGRRHLQTRQLRKQSHRGSGRRDEGVGPTRRLRRRDDHRTTEEPDRRSAL